MVVPAYDEEPAIEASLQTLRAALTRLDGDWEIIVVDDGSTDRTAELAGKTADRLISLPENRGYGAALKAGIASARYDRIVITDADGTYPADAIPDLLAIAERYDMVVGARVLANAAIPASRRPAKWVLRRLASYLAGRPIPDLNSGLRVIDRKLVDRFAHLLPSGFSFTTTITLAAICSDQLVHFHPIEYYEREGQSKIRPVHALDFLLLVLRTVVYFNPLKVFLPLGAFLFLIGLAKFAYDLVIGNLSETALLGFLGAAIVWAVGLLSDQISRLALRGSER